MADEILKVTALPMVMERKRLAVGMNLGTIAGILAEAGDATAPHFLAGQEPNRDGVFSAVDGQSWYRADLRVSDRPSSIGPYVWFGEDADGVVRLEFELEELGPGGATATSHPFPVTLDSLALSWHDSDGSHTRAFANPTVVPSPDQSRSPRFRVHVGDQLSREEVQTLYLAMKTQGAGAQVTVTMSYGYWIDSSSGSATTDPGPDMSGYVGIRKPRLSETLTRESTKRVALDASPMLTMNVMNLAVMKAMVASPSYGAEGASFAVGDVPLPVMVARIDSKTLKQLAVESRKRLDQHDFHRATYTRSVPFFFSADVADNAAIYRAIRGEQLTSTWTQNDNGWLRRAAYPNTVYRLPDELRLAFNADLGVPHVLPTLYRNEAGDAKVRVVMRILSWHNPETLVAIGDDLRSAPDFVVGGYESAALSFTGAFPDEIHALSGASVPITLETGLEVTLDLKVEYYTLLCQLLTGPIGLTGSVSVTLGQTQPTDGTPPQPIVRQVPVRLGLGVPAALPIDVSIPADAVSPAQVSVANRSGAAVTIGGCEPRLLQYDHNSVVPLDIFRARSTSTFPLALAAGASAAVAVSPLDPERAQLWNAVLAQLTGVHLDVDPHAVLDRIYEVAPVGTLEWTLSVECPPLATAPGPARFTSVIAVDVQVTRADGGRVISHLARTAATARLTMHRTLAELTSDSGEIGTFTYAVRNLYDDHAGAWSAAQSGEGSTLTVYPNNPTGD